MPSRQVNAADGIESFQLPKALVTRIAKSNLPGETKLQKDTVNALVDSATVFINFLAATAHEVTNSKSRKIITASDILQALELVDLSDLVPLLEEELELYRNSGKGERSKTSAEKKGKGKEKETVSETRPHEGNPLVSTLSHELEEEEADEQAEHDGADEQLETEQVDDVMEEDNEEQEDEDVEGEEDEEPEQLVDTVALEEEELLKDNQGLEASDAE